MAFKETLSQILYKKLCTITPLPVDELKVFEKHLKIESFKKNKLIFKQGDHDLNIYFILTGICYSFYIASNGE